MARVTHFEIPVDDPGRAMTVYERAFDWWFERRKCEGIEYGLTRTGPEAEPGIDGGLVPRTGVSPTGETPLRAFVCTLDVADVDAAVERVLEHGERVAEAAQDIPGVGTLAYVEDTEGNLFGLMQVETRSRRSLGGDRHSRSSHCERARAVRTPGNQARSGTNETRVERSMDWSAPVHWTALPSVVALL